MKKESIRGGLSSLLNPNPIPNTSVTNQTPIRTDRPNTSRIMKSERGTTIRICYNLNAEIVEKIKVIAAYDRKNINEVYNEALQAYIDNWQPTEQEPPKL